MKIHCFTHIKIRYLLWIFIAICQTLQGQNKTEFSGMAALWAGVNDSPQAWLGARYLPQIESSFALKNASLDFTAAANLWTSIQLNQNDTPDFSYDGTPYRLWGRYATDRLELRLGLQKINFGSANILRPLMWFDQLDPREPLKLTEGVWGLLGRYYFQNNSNLWLWLLYPSNELKTWEWMPSNMNFPEWGGRFQHPAGPGEIAFSYHHRAASSLNNQFGLPAHERIGETRLALDGKWDVGPGIWFESVLVQQNKDLDQLSTQFLMNLGADYTFGIGNGLQLTAEQLFASVGKNVSSLDLSASFFALSLSYPFSLFDQLLFMAYYDWKSKSAYSFAQYSYHIGKFDLMLMAWVNPSQYMVPGQITNENIFSGKGMQLMLVFHH